VTRDIFPISADDHCWERPDTFTSRVPAKFRDSCLQIRNVDGWDWWVYNDQPVRKVGTGCAALLPDRGEVKTFADAPLAAHDPTARLAAMDADGVSAQVLFPQASGFGGGPMSSPGNDELRLACLRAFNDYLAEEWAGFSPRYIAQCLVPVWDVNLACEEMRRAQALGHRAVVWTAGPQDYGAPHFNDAAWDPFWATAQELEMPVCLHIGSAKKLIDPWAGYSPFRSLAVSSTNIITSNVQTIANLLFSGVLDRFPQLKFVSVESGMGWVPYLLETCDHQYEAQHLWDDGMQMKPSEYFKRNVYVNFWFEASGVALRHMIGVDNILWEADFPHPTSTYPHSRKAIETSLAGVPTEEQYRMLEGNSRRVFKIDYDNAILPAAVKYTA
jgi:predicted TIM-barrel fold metal-dependent hydrolase